MLHLGPLLHLGPVVTFVPSTNPPLAPCMNKEDRNVRCFSQFKNSYGKVWAELGFFFKPLVCGKRRYLPLQD